MLQNIFPGARRIAVYGIFWYRNTPQRAYHQETEELSELCGRPEFRFIQRTFTLGSSPYDGYLFLYNTTGVFLWELYVSSSYTLLLPPGDYKIFAYPWSEAYGLWFNGKTSYAGADVIHLPPGGQATASFSVTPKPLFIPMLNKSNFKTGDRLQVDVQVTNGSIPTKVMVLVDILVPEQGLKSSLPVGNRLALFSGTIDVAANADFTATNIFSYTFSGAEPPGIYYIRILPLDLYSSYGYNYLDYSYYLPGFIFAP
jgi:hypothetical protein